MEGSLASRRGQNAASRDVVNARRPLSELHDPGCLYWTSQSSPSLASTDYEYLFEQIVVGVIQKCFV